MASQLYIQNETLPAHNNFATLKSSRNVTEFCFLLLDILPKKYLVMREYLIVIIVTGADAVAVNREYSMKGFRMSEQFIVSTHGLNHSKIHTARQFCDFQCLLFSFSAIEYG